MDYLYRKRVANSTAFLLPVIFAIVLANLADALRKPHTVIEAELWPIDRLQQFVDLITAQSVEAHFEAHGYAWFPQKGGSVPPIAIARMPRDLAEIGDTRKKKDLFFRALLPIVLAENRNIRYQRRYARELLAKGADRLDLAERVWLDQLTRWYGVTGDLSKPERAALLLRRVDEIPVPLVLAQAANESAWGTSRFAQEANNLFGQWTFDDNQGLVPLGRGENENHSVRMFKDVRESVRAYMRNLNTHRAYASLRRERENIRRQRLPVDVYALAGGLRNYSQRGIDYVSEIRAMIRSNELEQLLYVDLSISADATIPLVAVKAVSTSG